MYIAPTAWIGLITATCIGALGGSFNGGNPTLGLVLFAVVLGLAIAPKLAGVIDVALSRGATPTYGGRLRFYASVAFELVGSTLAAPIVAVSICIFMIGLVFGKGICWQGQNRDVNRVAWLAAGRTMAPHTAAGLAIAAIVYGTAGLAGLAWALPLVVGLSCAIPLAVVTASPVLGRFLIRARLFAIPEEDSRRRDL